MRFQYKGTSRTREKVSGVLEAQDVIEAKLKLRAMQIRPEVLNPEPKPLFNLNLKKLSLTSPVKLKQLIIFTRQLSSLIDSGVPVVQALDLLEQQEANKTFKKILFDIRKNIESGGTLSKGLEKHPNVFSEFFIRVIEAGEMSGTLDKSLRSIGVQLEKLAKLKAKVVKALTYPLLTLVASIIAVSFLLVKVIPEISKLYGSSKLPDLTIFVLGISSWVQTNFLFLLGVVIGTPFCLGAIYRISVFRDLWDPLLLKMPLFGTLVMRSAVARFSRTLGTLVGSGVSLLDGFEICTKVISNRALKKAIHEAATGVTQGKSIVDGLSKSGYFPAMVIHMVGIGEMTGKLDELLNKVAEIYDEEVDNAVDTITTLLQPLLIMAVGGIILFLMLAMYMPIFSLGEKMGNG
jgi:type IV pilus assembly protein PilC